MNEKIVIDNPIIAHRGWSSKAPENTLAAIELALNEDRIDMIEIDVQLTKDEEIVVVHDFVLGRTSNGTGQLGDHTLAELKVLDFGGWFSKDYIGEKIPTLQEVLDVIKGKKTLMIEIKKSAGYSEGIAVKLCEMIKDYPYKEQLMIKSFDHQLVKEVKKIDCTLEVGILIYGKMTLLVEEVESVGASFVSANNAYVDRVVVDELADHNVDLYVYTVDEIEEMKRLNGLDSSIGIITNKPQCTWVL